MSKRSDAVYLGVLLDAAIRARDLAAEITRERFDGDVYVQLALTHLIENIGEAASKVPDAIRSTCPDIEWHAIVGMRHRIVHDYLSVDLDEVWATIQEDVTPLIKSLEAHLTPPEPPSA